MSFRDEDGPVELELGLIVARRWKIMKKLGEGGCGSVYRVQDTKRKVMAALKAESNALTGGVLKLEVQVLKRLAHARHVAFLLQAGKKTHFSYMVTVLLGPSLERLLLSSGGACGVSTQVRVAIHCLFGLKQLHEVGYVHRDVKPSNLAVGRRGPSTRVFHLLDFGLCREFVIRTKSGIKMLREPRAEAQFRGTSHYCSINTHEFKEQGRVDDLWSMLYLIAEMRDQLPWNRATSKPEIYKIKLDTRDSELLFHSHPKLIEIATHLRTLNYYSRPDYFLIYRVLNNIMISSHFSHSDPFEWERNADSSMKISRRVSLPDGGEPSTVERKTSEAIIDYSAEALKSVRSTTEEEEVDEDMVTALCSGRLNVSESEAIVNANLFSDADFSSNILGF